MLGKPDSTIPLLDRGRDGSVNSVLEHTLAEAHLGSRVTQWLERVPPERPILIISPHWQNRQATLAADVLSYLAWPRPARVVFGAQESIAHLAQFPAHYGAVAFCHLPPPPGFAPGTAFGPALTLVAAPSAQP
jgi:hypothetical protein